MSSSTGFKCAPLTLGEGVQFRHGIGVGKQKEADKGQTSAMQQWTGGKMPHPPNMYRYDDLAQDPEAGIGLDLLADMIAGVGSYTEMPPKDSKDVKIDPNHKNKISVDEWARGINAQKKYREIEYTKLCKGFCPVERLDGGGLKIMPPESFYIWRDVFGRTLKYTQDVGNSEVAKWETKEDMEKIVLFILHEDTAHPYGRSILDKIADLIEARKQINKDMPKIIHRYSAPRGVFATGQDVTDIYNAVTGADVDEDLYFGHVTKEDFWFQFMEPSGQVRFLEYINQISFQIGEGLHAPLILLLRNASEASARTMLESVDRMVQGEQRYDSSIIEDRFYKPMVGIPTPLHKFGAPRAVLDAVTLTDIGTLKGNGTVTFDQAQDLIRQKGIPLPEIKEPDPAQAQPDMPLLDPGKMHALNLSLDTIKSSFLARTITVTEAIREGDRSINVYVDKARQESRRKVSEALGKVVDKLSPETERCFIVLRNELFDRFRESILPTKLQGAIVEQTRTFTVTALQ
jgi:hypothetical protein